MTSTNSIEEKITSLHADGVIDMHYDLPLSLFLSRPSRNVIATNFLPEFESGDIGLLGVALYIEDKYLGEQALRVALDQVALLKAELQSTPQLVLCRTFAEIEQAREKRKIALLLTMEGAEPLGDDLNLLGIFHELGLRAISLTHARVNAAAAGGIFAASGSPTTGLTSFGRELVQTGTSVTSADSDAMARHLPERCVAPADVTDAVCWS